MKIADLVIFAGGALRGHRLRTTLSVAGVAMGVAAVIALTALGEGARRYVVAEFENMGSNILIVIPGRVETSGAMPFGGVTHDLTLEDFSAILTRLPRVKGAAPVAVGQERVRAAGRSRSVSVIGTTSGFQQVRRTAVASGRFLSPGDPDRGGNELVLGVKVARELFGSSNPLGQVVRVGPWRFRVVGVLAPKGRSLGFDFDDLVLVPVATAMSMLNRSSLFRIIVEVGSAEELAAAKDEVVELLKQRHRAEDVTVITQDAMVGAFSSILQALTLALVAIASVSLSVAGVGIMNVMLVSVAERRSEIGLLRALGASSAQVLWVFLAEAVVLSAFGGLVGLAVGAAAIRAFVGFYPNFPASPPLWAVVAGLGMSVVVGAVFGVLPARRATRLDPVAALARR